FTDVTHTSFQYVSRVRRSSAWRFIMEPLRVNVGNVYAIQAGDRQYRLKNTLRAVLRIRWSGRKKPP
ncbi:hypothetical protein ACIPH3_11215, partial [Enterobacter sp. CER55]